MPTIEIYPGYHQGDAGDGWRVAPNGLWYWRLVAANNRVVADGSEGYVSKANARRAAIRAANLIEIAEIVYL